MIEANVGGRRSPIRRRSRRGGRPGPAGGPHAPGCAVRTTRDKAPPEHYVTFMEYCIQQCTATVDEDDFGESLLKTLDEWNFCVWTKGWLPDPRG
jgi:hypothetical protein